jgi:fluoroacetyl-CoA thioesterase
MTTPNPVDTIKPGMRGEARVLVTHELTVQHTMPQMPAVYGTPYMIHLMEVAAADAIASALPPGWASVGVGVNIEHLGATPMGRTVTATAVVTGTREKVVELDVEAHDGVRLIGKGTHTRAPIDIARFLRRIEQS